jgi:hypothetical protein
MCQGSIVNVLTKIGKPSKLRCKWILSSAIFLHALPHNITFNFYFWTNSSCLTNFGERGMSMSMLPELGLKNG